MINWSVGPCRERARAIEWIEMPDTPEDDLDHAFDFLEFSDRRLGGDRVILNFLADASARWSHGMPVSIFIPRCGRGGLARHVANWGRKHDYEFHIYAVDGHDKAVRLARERHRNYPEITFEVRELSDPMFLQAGQFDYVLSSLGLHHEPPSAKAVESALITMNRVARRGLIAYDWLRDVRAYTWMSAAVKVWGDAIVKHDGPLAIQRGFSPEEAEAVMRRAGLDFAFMRLHFGYRFSISGERGLSFAASLNPLPGILGPQGGFRI